MSTGVPPIDTLDSSPRALVRALVLEQGFLLMVVFLRGSRERPPRG